MLFFMKLRKVPKPENRVKKIQLYRTVAGTIVQTYCIKSKSIVLIVLEINRNKLSKVIKKGVDFAKERRKG